MGLFSMLCATVFVFAGPAGVIVGYRYGDPYLVTLGAWALASGAWCYGKYSETGLKD